MDSLLDKKIPDNQAISKALKTAGNNLELIKLIHEKCVKIAKISNREEEMQPAFSAIDDTISMAEYAYNARKDLYEKLWNGTISTQEIAMLRADYFNFQDLLAQKKLQEIDEKIIADKMRDVVMIYDINDNAEFVRAYISNGKQLDVTNPDEKKIIDLYDQCFHSWLVNNKMSSQDGVIYNTSKLDKKGNYIARAKSEDIVKIITDPDMGLNVAIKKQNPVLSLDVQRNEQKPTKDLTKGG